MFKCHQRQLWLILDALKIMVGLSRQSVFSRLRSPNKPSRRLHLMPNLKGRKLYLHDQCLNPHHFTLCSLCILFIHPANVCLRPSLRVLQTNNSQKVRHQNKPKANGYRIVLLSGRLLRQHRGKPISRDRH